MSRKRVHTLERDGHESPKRLLTNLPRPEVELEILFMLPFKVLDYILTKCNISEIRNLGMVSKQCRDLVLSWLDKDTSTSIFPALMSSGFPHSIKYQIRGSNKLYAFDPKKARENFYEVRKQLHN